MCDQLEPVVKCMWRNLSPSLKVFGIKRCILEKCTEEQYMWPHFCVRAYKKQYATPSESCTLYGRTAYIVVQPLALPLENVKSI